MTYKIINSDLLEYLADNQDAAKSGDIPKYHAVLCDPPYGIDFMSKGWDKYTPKAYQAWVTEWATMMLDFVHAGGVLMAFGGTRTYHRLVCGLEDAGWEIQDSLIAWTYGSGFPKSHNVSKSIDKHLGAEREVVGQRTDGRYAHKFQDTNNHMGQLNPTVSNVSKIGQITAPATPEAALFDGMGSALKPSYEPIVVCRKPRGGLTYAECALQFGSGGLNIDGGRIGTEDNTGRSLVEPTGWKQSSKQVGSITDDWRKGRWPANTILMHHPECTDETCHPICHVRVMGEQSGELGISSGGNIGSKNSMFIEDSGYAHKGQSGLGDSGDASRFFYQAKSSNWERNAGLGEDYDNRSIRINAPRLNEQGKLTTRRNSHPTIKPIKLCEHLATLLKTPVADSRILIPFSGSGSEMIGAVLAGWSQFDSYEEAQAASGYEKEADAIKAEKKASGQLSLFEGII